MSEQTFDKNNKREIFGWVTYDWANSVFFTIVVTAFAGKYLTALAQSAVGDNGSVINLFGYDLVTAKSMFPYAVGLSVFLQIWFLPILGAIADYTRLKKTFMLFFTAIGVVACCLLFLIQGNLYLIGTLLFLFANLGVGAAIVFYNSFLSDITTEDLRDKVSSYGFAAGYVSGSLILFLALFFVKDAESFGISKGMAIRICFLFSGLWWGIFAIPTMYLLKTRIPSRAVPQGKHIISAGLGELIDSFKILFKLKHTLKFLCGYLVYNDGIQTVITMSGLFIEQELFVRKGIEMDNSILLIALLIAQVAGFFGSLIFERIAHYTSSKISIIISLIIWSGIVIYAYAFLQTVTQAYFMSGAIGLVLGGSQALSRSLFSQMIPKGRESSFFGIYEISERGTSWLGPILFGLVAQMTDSYRPAILVLIVFFIFGCIVLAITDTTKAIHDAGQHTPEEASHLHN